MRSEFMPESTTTHSKSEFETGHTTAYPHPLDDPAVEAGRRRGILFLLILTAVTILLIAGFLYRVFSVD
jgi:hypothetical protein